MEGMISTFNDVGHVLTNMVVELLSVMEARI